MSAYRPPLRDIRFVMEEVADLAAITATERFGHADADTIHEVLAEVGRFMAEVVAPTNRDGDTIGATFPAQRRHGSVTAAPGLKKAYQPEWVESGLGRRSPFDPEEYGGGNFPWLLGDCRSGDAHRARTWRFSLCPLLTQGAIDAIHVHHGPTRPRRTTYLPQDDHR